ncbi:hypothetical protein HYC85_031213 [Camellia sinensis]|uniref:Uncharacterized protein n=1 Tax=Camellia sinensis TaxID=4442 RepID=A0A7J7FQ17_CAMSI|nr:hypothetical protein HYC85_031213 [Camellia sinensis]
MDRPVKADVKEVNLTFSRGQKSTATFRLTNLMQTMSVAVSPSTTNPSSLSFPNPFSILPPLSTSSFTLHLSSDHPPLSSPPDTMLVRSSMLPTGKTHQDDLCRLFSKPGAHIFKDATIPISLVGPHVIASLFSPPYNKSFEVSFLLSKAISGYDESESTNLLKSATGFGNVVPTHMHEKRRKATNQVQLGSHQPTCMKNVGRQPTKSSLAATNHSKGQEWRLPKSRTKAFPPTPFVYK